MSTVGGLETAYAATGIKKATLNNAKVRFNNGYVQTLQCYNIDGYNFVRARDITNNLGMAVTALQDGSNGISINPFSSPTSTSTPEKLTQKSATVRVEKGNIVYDGIPYSAECFLLNGRYYFKLADFASAADESVGITLMYLETMKAMGMEGDYFFNYYPTISVTWNNATKIIDVQMLIIDANSATSPSTSAQTKPETVINSSNQQLMNQYFGNFTPQKKLTSAPREGQVLADILIDDSKGAYLDAAMTKVNSNNYNPAYRWVAEVGPCICPVGQCTWYAWGRFIETVGTKILSNPFEQAYTINDWVTNAQSSSCPDLKGVTNPYDISARSIAVWENHVAFVEWVDYDNNGNPTWVYFTEANANHYGNVEYGVYYPDYDCKVKKLDIDSFIERDSFVGYVALK